LIDYREPPLEFAEVASMGMELLAARYLDEFYGDAGDAQRSMRDMLERTVLLFPWVATVDAFQHWLYTHPGHSRAERSRAWVGTFKRFQPDTDFTGHEEALDTLWHRQLHIFLAPFYYIEYAIAEIGALQVWRRARADQSAAVKQYRAALALGGTEPLPRLFAAAGAEFDFSARTLGPLMDAIAGALDGAR
jgi:oligoendopeptidase F